MPVSFHEQTRVRLPRRKKLKSFLNVLAETEGFVLADLSIVFCTDEYLREINRKFLNHDYYTDVLTFNLGSKDQIITGEIYISTERIKENAILHQATFNEELHRVIFHGALHLCGFNDKSTPEILAMRATENKYLKKYLLKCST